MSMGDLQGKANQLEKAIQETAFEGIQERREYAIGMRLIEVASDVARISDSLEEIDKAGSMGTETIGPKKTDAGLTPTE
jgi:hypothetical protein